MGRFEDMQKLNSITADAALTSNKKEDQKKRKNIVIYNVREDIYNLVEATGESFSSFAKRGIVQLAKKEGLIS